MNNNPLDDASEVITEEMASIEVRDRLVNRIAAGVIIWAAVLLLSGFFAMTADFFWP